MRGVFFPNANVVFSAQSHDPALAKRDIEGSRSTDPVASVFGGWEAIENSGLALADTADLLLVAGRACSNGRPAPVQDAAWKRFVQELREAGLASYAAAQAESQDQILDVSDRLTMACGNCHSTYREPGGAAGRCRAASARAPRP